MCSRPKRLCKDAANQALGYESDRDSDIYDDASSNNENELEDVLDLGELTEDDEILEEQQLIEYS
jgi:hypothetical protein